MTFSPAKSRISDPLFRQGWLESPSPTDVRLGVHALPKFPKVWRAATDHRGWQAHANAWAFQNPQSDPPVLDSLVTIDRLVADASWVMESEERDWEDGISYDRRTIEQVRDLLKSLALIARDTFNYHLKAPHPAPADEGSIDVFFEGAERNLLINTPQGDDELVTYFGSDRSGTTFGGSLSRKKDHRDLMALAAWILEIR